MMTDTDSKAKPNRTKMLPVVNRGDHVIVGRSGGLFSVMHASDRDKSWSGFHLMGNAIEEAKALRDSLNAVIAEMEKTPQTKP